MRVNHQATKGTKRSMRELSPRACLGLYIENLKKRNEPSSAIRRLVLFVSWWFNFDFHSALPDFKSFWPWGQ
jgi:hypothetical protein